MFSRQMQACQGLPCGSGMSMTLERRPRQCIAVQVHALGEVVYFIGPFTLRRGGRALAVRQHRRHRRAALMQMADQAVFFFQPCGLAHPPVMPFDE
ncbi:hypothetical protein [Pseudomonas veronii]|uniref:hypothetical protein n=1 Tax=Pseudomonas veronii TaxID=76761 RepID=UPI002D765B18|nr:hypothetical protein [Pseudomonas veronii]WRU64986.1 hypothetical protein VPH48_11475 [Pseudomonas veronii]